MRLQLGRLQGARCAAPRNQVPRPLAYRRSAGGFRLVRSLQVPDQWRRTPSQPAKTGQRSPRGPAADLLREFGPLQHPRTPCNQTDSPRDPEHLCRQRKATVSAMLASLRHGGLRTTPELHHHVPCASETFDRWRSSGHRHRHRSRHRRRRSPPPSLPLPPLRSCRSHVVSVDPGRRGARQPDLRHRSVPRRPGQAPCQAAGRAGARAVWRRARGSPRSSGPRSGGCTGRRATAAVPGRSSAQQPPAGRRSRRHSRRRSCRRGCYPSARRAARPPCCRRTPRAARCAARAGGGAAHGSARHGRPLQQLCGAAGGGLGRGAADVCGAVLAVLLDHGRRRPQWRRGDQHGAWALQGGWCRSGGRDGAPAQLRNCCPPSSHPLLSCNPTCRAVL